MGVTVSVSRYERGLGHPEAARLVKRAVAATLRAEGITVPCHVDVLFCGLKAIRDINREQRNVDSATDVLSFPQNDLAPGAFSPEGCETDYDTGEIQLGDMVLSIPRCEAQGEEYGHGFTREVSYLAVHSTLHLLGYDHLDEGPQKRQMRAREDAIMERLEAGGKRK